MASKGIRDRVAIVGMGCTPFGEHWDKGADDLLVDSATAAFDSAGVAKDDVDAYWLGTMGSGISGLTLSRPLKLDYKPVTRLENMCATGSEAFRNACYAVASGAVDRMSQERLAETPATIATYTVDRLAFSLSPPVVAAVVDFDDGGRFRCEMTDVDPDTVAIGNRVEMTFRRISTVGGIHNYFWKARPAREGES